MTGGPEGSVGGLPDEVRREIDPQELPAIERLGERLRSERPQPPVLLRSSLRRRILELGSSPQRARAPARLRLQVAAYLTSGFATLAVAALGLAGVGPLGY